jgi:methionyl-tRNA formyltransferase
MNLIAKVIGEGAIYDGVRELLRRQWWRLVEEAPYDILILANVTRILQKDELSIAKTGVLCFHPSLLPRHRGRDAVYWTLKMGDTTTGATWFCPDAGIDTGPVVTQREVAIPDGVSPGRLYYDTLVPLGIELLQEILPTLEGAVLTCTAIPSTPQDEGKATYEQPRSRHMEIDATKWIQEVKS